MKKTLLLVAAIATMSLSANAQWLDFSNNSHRFSIGFQIGQSAVGTDYSKLGLGMSIQALGIHVDFIRVVPEHKYDNHVDPSLQYNDSSSYNINLGHAIVGLAVAYEWHHSQPGQHGNLVAEVDVV